MKFDVHKITKLCFILCSYLLLLASSHDILSDCGDLLAVDENNSNSLAIESNGWFSTLYNIKFNHDSCLRNRDDWYNYGAFVDPEPLSNVELVDFNEYVATYVLGLSPSTQLNNSANIVEESKSLSLLLSGNILPLHSKSFAQSYGGNQFGYWAGRLGDGRATSYGRIEITNTSALGYNYFTSSHTWDWQLKGSGRTPYSRGGDGRAVLRSSVREYLGSWALFNLGVPTSLCLSLTRAMVPSIPRDPFESGNVVIEPAAVTTRISPSWLRFGSFEYLFKIENYNSLAKLIDYSISEHFPQFKYLLNVASKKQEAYLLFLQEIVLKTAELVAHWQSVGFCHGVMNTDNFSILAISIDFGPFQFMERFDRDLQCNLSDHDKRYTFSNQPSIAYWNLEMFSLSLSPFLDATSRKNCLSSFYPHFNEKYYSLMYEKLGFTSIYPPSKHQANTLVDTLLNLLHFSNVDYHQFFANLTNTIPNSRETSISELPLDWAFSLFEKTMFNDWFEEYYRFLLDTNASFLDVIQIMKKRNPTFILRNYLAQEVIENAEKGDYHLLKLWKKLLADPFHTQPEMTGISRFSIPSQVNLHPILVSCSS